MTFDECATAYEDQVRGLIDGGADLLLLETIFDTLNAKAGDRRDRERVRGEGRPPAADDLGDGHGSQRPNAVGTDARRVLHLDPPRAAVRRRHQLRARRTRDAPVPRGARAPRRVLCASATRTPGCPTRSASTTNFRTRPAQLLSEFVTGGLVNIVGGCCGTTPDHIAADRARRSKDWRRGRCPAGSVALGASREPAQPASREHYSQFSGLETLTIRPDSNFQMIGERTNVTGSAKFARLIRDGDYADGRAGRARAGPRRRQHDRRQHGRRHARLRAGHDDVPQLHRDRAGDRPRAGDDRQLEVVRARGGAQVRPGQGRRQFDQPQGRARPTSCTRRSTSSATAPASW